MKTITNIKSKNKPDEIDNTSSDQFVYVRSNIQKVIDVDPVFKTETEMYTYDETQYTLAEWVRIITDGLNDKFSKLQSEIKEIKIILSKLTNTEE